MQRPPVVGYYVCSMAAKKQGEKATPTKLWLGAFSLLEAGRGESSFQIIGRARDPDDAARLFEERLLHLRATTSLFDKESSVYLDAIIDLDAGTFPVPTLVNYVARKESSQSDVWSPAPEQPDSRAEIYGWGEDGDNDEPIERQPFVEFEKRKASSKAKVASKAKAKTKTKTKTKSAKRPAAAKRGR